jgi:hypothetical protein
MQKHLAATAFWWQRMRHARAQREGAASQRTMRRMPKPCASDADAVRRPLCRSPPVGRPLVTSVHPLKAVPCPALVAPGATGGDAGGRDRPARSSAPAQAAIRQPSLRRPNPAFLPSPLEMFPAVSGAQLAPAMKS